MPENGCLLQHPAWRACLPTVAGLLTGGAFLRRVGFNRGWSRRQQFLINAMAADCKAWAAGEQYINQSLVSLRYISGISWLLPNAQGKAGGPLTVDPTLYPFSFLLCPAFLHQDNKRLQSGPKRLFVCAASTGQPAQSSRSPQLVFSCRTLPGRSSCGAVPGMRDRAPSAIPNKL